MGLGTLIFLGLLVVVLAIGLFTMLTNPTDIDAEEEEAVEKEQQKRRWWRR